MKKNTIVTTLALASILSFQAYADGLHYSTKGHENLTSFERELLETYSQETKVGLDKLTKEREEIDLLEKEIRENPQIIMNQIIIDKLNKALGLKIGSKLDFALLKELGEINSDAFGLPNNIFALEYGDVIVACRIADRVTKYSDAEVSDFLVYMAGKVDFTSIDGCQVLNSKGDTLEHKLHKEIDENKFPLAYATLQNIYSEDFKTEVRIKDFRYLRGKALREKLVSVESFQQLKRDGIVITEGNGSPDQNMFMLLIERKVSNKILDNFFNYLRLENNSESLIKEIISSVNEDNQNALDLAIYHIEHDLRYGHETSVKGFERAYRLASYLLDLGVQPKISFVKTISQAKYEAYNKLPEDVWWKIDQLENRARRILEKK